MTDIVLMNVPPIEGAELQVMLDKYCPRAATTSDLSGPRHPESATLADDFANGKSVDVSGRRLHLYDRVLVSEESFTAIIVAIVADKLLAVVDDDTATMSKGTAVYEDGKGVRFIGRVEHPKFHVAGLVDDYA